MQATVSGPPELKRQLGLTSAIALVIGEVIAVGIFLTPAGMAKSIGSPVIIAAMWLVMGALSILGALCYGELAARYPEAGGGYVYLRQAFGPRVAFLYGWKCFLVLDPGLTAALSVGIASYVGYLIKLSWVETKAIAVGSIAFVAVVNIYGVRSGALLMRTITIVKLGLLLFIPIWALVFQLGNWSNFLPLVAQRAGSAPLGGALAGAFVGGFFSLGGWWDVNKLAGEVREPQRILPRALTAGLLIVMTVYLITSAVFLYLVPIERVTSGETFAAQAGEALFGRSGGLIFSTVVIACVFGSLTSFMMAAPRVYYAMARDHLFPAPAAAVHPRLGTPTRAIALQATVASVLVLTGSFDDIVAYFIFVTVAFIGITVAGLFILRKEKGASPAYLVPGYPAVPTSFLVFIAALLALLAIGKPQQAAIGVAVVALGFPVYQFIFRHRVGSASRTPETVAADVSAAD
ncbi:MAG TPA: amino acid permease [Blastocatellia bacterium]|nr:amino acid permease [Blastocatellia bacterium]